jgi:hypothetical protein
MQELLTHLLAALVTGGLAYGAHRARSVPLRRALTALRAEFVDREPLDAPRESRHAEYKRLVRQRNAIETRIRELKPTLVK